MLNQNIEKILKKSRARSWVLEPDAKALLASQKFDIPDFIISSSFEEADLFLRKSRCPLVVKAVSEKILHKTEHNAVVTNIVQGDHLEKEMTRLLALDGCEKVLIEHMIPGIELMIGAKNDFQFGPVIVLGIGGTSVEIYNDTAIRMAPLEPGDVYSMAGSLRAKEILTGYRGKQGVNLGVLTAMMVNFSHLVMELEDKIESVDLNPVICTRDRCVIADARIMLQ